jgi:hypothetical protein
MAYTGAATSLVRNHTLRVPTGEWSGPDSTSALSYWPPGYPAAIAIPVAAGISPIQGGRYVNIAAAAITAATLFFLIAAALSPPAGIVGVLVVCATPAVLDVHLSILSEPLFIALLMLTVATMVYARDQLLLLGALATAAVMVRYAGACAPAAVVIWTLLDSRYAPSRRLRRALVTAIPPTLAIVAWIARTALAQDRHGTPKLAVYGHWTPTIQQARDTFTEWLIPLAPDGTPRQVATAIVALILTILLLATVRDTANSSHRHQSTPAARVATILGASFVMACWYLAVVCASRLFVGATIPLDWRILSPLIVLLELMIVVSLAYWWRAYHRPMHILVTVLALAWGIAAAVASSNDALEVVTDGSDFGTTAWHDSPTLAWVRAHGTGHTLYSNWPPAVYFHAHRIARELPDSDEIRHDLPDFADALRSSNGLIVGFKEPSPDVIAPDSIAKLLHLRPLATFPDGTIWTP